MGLLAKGSPLSWAESLPYLEHVKEHGIAQFIHTYRRLMDRANDEFLWGDEVEYIIVKLSEDSVRLCLRGTSIVEELEKAQSELLAGLDRSVTYHPEFGSYMIEATPAKPYGGFTSDLRLVEVNMSLRRKLVNQALEDDEFLLSMTCFPYLGMPDSTFPSFPPGGPATLSEFVPDAIMNSHPRFP